MSLDKVEKGLFRGGCAPKEGSLGMLLDEFGAQVVVGHPTFQNQDNIGKELAKGIKAASEVYSGQKVAFVVSDGTCRMDSADESTMIAALAGASRTLRELRSEARDHLLIAISPYDGYRGDRTPGKGSALKLIFDELAFCPTVRKVILLDGDLRNDLKPWFDVFLSVEKAHRAHRGQRDFFITARYARHFVDASLTRFVVGPLTTLMGEYVPGGISGDIVLSAGAVRHERDAQWNEHRRRYGTDIATTFDNIADPETDIYEVYLGAKLHDITDEAKLSVMPREVIGSALTRLLHYENQDGRVNRQIRKEITLKRPYVWGPERTGIDFIDPGYTDVFDVDRKRATLVEKFPLYQKAIEKVLNPETLATLRQAYFRMTNLSGDDSDPFEFLGVSRDLWIDILYQNIAFLLSRKDIETVSSCMNYLYTAAFLEFCREKINSLGAQTFGEVRLMQKSLGVPAHQARNFYKSEVDDIVDRLAQAFYEGRRKILSYE
jgi:hypothetical protein